MTWHLQTERLSLRPMTTEDVDALVPVLGDAQAMRFYPRPFDRAMVEGWVARTLERYADDGFGLLALVERATGEVIGDCGPTLQDVDGSPFVELGWHVRADRQGRGYATEAAITCRDHAWATLTPPRLISLVRPENVPSWSVARRLGFVPWRGTVRAGMAHVVWSQTDQART
jgi:RimJ/RimL family protein N-acetyltransferase